MKVSILQMFLMFWITIFSLNAQTNERYIEVTGTSEVEITFKLDRTKVNVGIGNKRYSSGICSYSGNR